MSIVDALAVKEKGFQGLILMEEFVEQSCILFLFKLFLLFIFFHRLSACDCLHC